MHWLGRVGIIDQLLDVRDTSRVQHIHNGYQAAAELLLVCLNYPLTVVPWGVFGVVQRAGRLSDCLGTGCHRCNAATRAAILV